MVIVVGADCRDAPIDLLQLNLPIETGASRRSAPTTVCTSSWHTFFAIIFVSLLPLPPKYL